MKVSRLTLRVVLWLGVVLLLLAALGFFSINSQSVASWLADTIGARSDGTVRIANVRGTIARGLEIEAIDVDIDGYDIKLANVVVNFDLRGIIARALIVDSLSIESVSVLPVARTNDSAESSARSSPVLVLIRSIDIESIQTTIDDQSFALLDTSANFRLLNNHVEINELVTNYEDLRISGNGSATMAVEVQVETRVCAQGEYSQQSVSGCVGLSGALPELDVDVQFTSPATANATGSIVLSTIPELDLLVAARDVDLPFDTPGISNLVLRNVDIAVTGLLDGLRVEGDGNATYDGGDVAFELAAIRNTEIYTVESLSVRIGESTLDFSGSVGADFTSASGDIRANAIDPALYVPELPGRLDLRGSVNSNFSPSLEIALQDFTVGGSLRDYPIVATGSMRYADDMVFFDSVQVASRSDTASISGSFGAQLDLQVAASISDLAIAGPTYGGRLEGAFAITGEQSALRFDGSATASDLRFAENSAAELSIRGSGDLDPQGVIAFVAEGQAVVVGGAVIDSLSLRADGVAGAHEMTLDVRSDQWQSSAVLNGGIQEAVWRGTIEQWSIEPSALDSWSLDEAVILEVSTDRVLLERACLLHDTSRICADINVAGTDDDRLEIDATQFDIATLRPFVPIGIRAEGTLDLAGEFFAVTTQPHGTMSLTSTASRVEFDIGGSEPLVVPINRAQFDIDISATESRIRAEVDSGDLGTLQALVETAVGPADSNLLSGRIDARLADTAVFSLLSPDVGVVSGQIDLAIELDGTLENPAFAGTGHWLSGSLEVPEWGLTIDGIEAEANAVDATRAEFQALGYIDGTPVRIDGQAFIDELTQWRAEARLTGEEVHLVQLPDADVFVVPDLFITVDLPNIEVTGDVSIPRARFSQLALPEQAIVPSADTVVHREGVVEEAHPLDVRAAISLTLGDDVRYEDASLNAQVGGSLMLDYRSERGASAQGGLTVAGQYDAYGNPLTLERGELIFVGPLDNPSLDIRAVRRIGEIAVGIQLAGTLRNPQSSIFSEPVMNEADALSYLLFGRPIDAAGAGDSSALRNAALSMGLRQALPAIERVGQSLGFDEFAIRNTDTDPGALMAGKYIGPNVYLRYSYGLFNRIGGLLLRYRINDRFSLETLSGEQKSMDLLYTVEKN